MRPFCYYYTTSYIFTYMREQGNCCWRSSERSLMTTVNLYLYYTTSRHKLATPSINWPLNKMGLTHVLVFVRFNHNWPLKNVISIEKYCHLKIWSWWPIYVRGQFMPGMKTFLGLSINTLVIERNHSQCHFVITHNFHCSESFYLNFVGSLKSI